MKQFEVCSNNNDFVVYEVTIDEDGDKCENQIFNLGRAFVWDEAQAYTIYMKDIIKEVMEKNNCNVEDAITKLYVEALEPSDFFDGYTFDMLPKDIQDKLTFWVRLIVDGIKLSEDE